MADIMEVPGSNYKANDRSVVVLPADLQWSGLKLNRNDVVSRFGGEEQLTAVTGGRLRHFHETRVSTSLI
jgi:hypothetical protein